MTLSPNNNSLNTNHNITVSRSLSSSMRSEYSLPDATIINVFTCEADGYLGWAYLPWQYSEGSKYQVRLIAEE